uniref:Uncharacterized protein n=1 Tax=viral metagenome TaxID=1070528 RepID=A0A6C0H7N0_9ZZZZ
MSNLFSAKPLVKPLKGGSVSSNLGVFDTVTANTIKLESVSIAGVFEDGIFLNVIIQDSEIRNTVIGVDGPNVGYFTKLQTRSDVNLYSNLVGAAVNWDPDTAQFYISSTRASFKVDGCSFLGNLEICRNDISATNFNGDINIIPNNLGTLYLKGPITNITSNGNFYSELAKGSASFIIDNDFKVYSSHGSSSITSFASNSIRTINGDISLQTDTGLGTKLLSVVRTTNANVLLTSVFPHQLKSGDVFSVTNGSLNGLFTVGNILNDTVFTLNGTSGAVFYTTGGSFAKLPSNNIVLNSKNLVKIPDRIPLTFGDTTNSISAGTSGMIISSYGDVFINTNANNTNANNIVRFPQDAKLQLGTSGSNYINYDGHSININSANQIDLNGSLTTIDTINTKFYDPIITLANYNLVSNDDKDRGVEFNYFDSTTNSMKMGWFGYKNTTKLFTFIPDASNTNEIISGTPGNFELNNLQVSLVNLNPGGTFNANCGKLLNVNLITGCGNNLTLAGSSNVTVNASNRISLAAGGDILLPNGVPVRFGTAGTAITETTQSTLNIVAAQNVQFSTVTFGAIIVPVATSVSFDGSSTGAQRISSDTSGNLSINTNKALFLTTTGGNVIVPGGTPIQFGTATQLISGNTSGITVVDSCEGGIFNVISNSNVNISSSFGNIVLSPSVGDIDLFPSTGNVRIPQRTNLIFSTAGTANSITLDSSGTLVLTGNATNTIRLTSASNIDLIASSSVNIPTNTLLRIGSYNQSFLYSDSSNGTWYMNTSTSGSLSLSGPTINLISTTGTLNVNNTTTSFSSGTFQITGTVGSLIRLDTDNVRTRDPIITLADYTLTDFKDRGIEYRYNPATSGSKLGWFGRKDTTNRFTYYSDAINSAEVISGTMGDLEIASVYVNNNLIFNNNGFLNLNCGTIANVNTITGCTGVLNFNATNTINTNTANLSLNATNQISVPFNVPINFGNTGNSWSCDSAGNFTVRTGRVIFNSDVQINGTTSTVYSTVTNIQDPIISLGGVIGPIVDDNRDRGIEFKWNDGVSSKTGFFGFKDSTGRFVYIRDGTNVDEVFTGPYSDVQFGDAYLTNIALSNGGVSGVSTLSGGVVTIRSTAGNVSILPITGSSILVPYNVTLGFGTTENGIRSDTGGNVLIQSQTNATILAKAGGVNISTSDSVRVPDRVPFYFGQNNSTYLLKDSSGNFGVTNSTGNIDLTPRFSSGSVNIPSYNYLNFGSSSNSVYSDGTQLILNGFKGISINSSNVTIAGSINIVGSVIASASGDFDLNKFILPLGTSQILQINAISNAAGTSGNIQVTTATTGYLQVGDLVTLFNTNTSPIIDGSYIITSINSPTSFNISSANTLTTTSTTGSIRTILTRDQGKDVGIQVNYWSTTGNTSVTAGSAGYKTGFFGFKRNTERWSFYTNITSNNSVVTGSLSDIEVNKVFASRMSGFVLDGGVTAGTNTIAGSSFQIGGGSINSTPIGTNVASTGRFTTLSNTVQASFNNVTLQSTLAYSVERYTFSATSPATRSPSDSIVVSMFSVLGTNYTATSGTMPSTGIADGTFKMLVCSNMGPGCQHTVFFGAGKLITPNPINAVDQPTRLVFKRRSQSAQMLWDNQQSAWILLASGAYVQ